MFACLSFLCENNDQYKTHGIEISLSNLALLPEDGIPDNFKTLIARSEKLKLMIVIFVIVNEEEDIYQAYIETEVDNLLEVDKISFKLNWPLTDPIPINEFNFDGICSFAFPKLLMKGRERNNERKAIHLKSRDWLLYLKLMDLSI